MTSGPPNEPGEQRQADDGRRPDDRPPEHDVPADPGPAEPGDEATAYVPL